MAYSIIDKMRFIDPIDKFMVNNRPVDSVLVPPKEESNGTGVAVASMTVPNSLFNAINKNLFNNALHGVTLKWSNKLKTRTTASWAHSSEHSEITLNKSLISKCTRKQLMESILYEMIYMYLLSKLPKTNEKEEYLQALLKRAMDFINTVHGTNLSFNYPYLAHQTTESFTECIDLNDSLNVYNQNNTIICLSDESDDDDDDVMIVEENNNINISVQPLLTVKIKVQDLQDESGSFCVDCCCANYNAAFSKCFTGTRINLPPKEQPSTAKCPVCCDVVERGNLVAHCNSGCSAFRA